MDAHRPVLDSFETHPDRYRHWKLSFGEGGQVATLAMNVQEDAGLSPDYSLKLNSYDLGVDIELADALERVRFEHPGVGCVVVTSLKEKLFCAGANIFMLGLSSHAWKVNFCKFTNETRLAMEDASSRSGIRFLAALNGIAAGGGYELALACDEIFLIDDGASSVSLPEVPLLGVLPGTGGLTRVIDKRKVRRDLADAFCVSQEGVRGERAVAWRLIDRTVPKSRFAEAVSARARELAGESPRPKDVPRGIELSPLSPKISPERWEYPHLSVSLDRSKRMAEVTLAGPRTPQPENPEGILQAGPAYWPLAAFRALDDAILRLRVFEPEVGLLLLRTTGDPDAVAAVDATLVRHQEHWLVKEVIGKMARTLRRLDVSSKTVYAVIEPGSCFAGSLFELALAADRSYMRADDKVGTRIRLTAMNLGALRTWNHLTRLANRFHGDPEGLKKAVEGGSFDAEGAELAGLVTFAPDDIDWEDEVRLAIEERAAMSPDALTGMESNLRWPGPETMETKIFGRLSAWQNWIFQRPNAVGEKGALKVYGKSGMKPEFDWRRV